MYCLSRQSLTLFRLTPKFGLPNPLVNLPGDDSPFHLVSAGLLWLTLITNLSPSAHREPFEGKEEGSLGIRLRNRAVGHDICMGNVHSLSKAWDAGAFSLGGCHDEPVQSLGLQSQIDLLCLISRIALFRL